MKLRLTAYLVLYFVCGLSYGVSAQAQDTLLLPFLKIETPVCQYDDRSIGEYKLAESLTSPSETLGKYVIEDQLGYTKLKNICGDESAASGFPAIDFNEQSLLGYFIMGSCGTWDFEPTLWKDRKRKTIHYAVSVKTRDVTCSGPGRSSSNFVIVPKIPRTYRVVFEPPIEKRVDDPCMKCMNAVLQSLPKKPAVQ